MTTPGARWLQDRIGGGLTASKADDAVVDVMTGAPLKFTVTNGAISSWRVPF